MPKQESYNLQRVLEMRARAQDEAAAHLVECRRQLSLAEDELERRKQSVEDCRQAQRDSQRQMVEKSAGGIKQTEIVIFRQHLADLREKEQELLLAVENQERSVQRAEQVADKALEKLSEAAKETKIIENHRENWQAARKVENNRREQKINDEIGAILHEKIKLNNT